MRANIAATDIDHDGGDPAPDVSRRCNMPLNAACARACDLARDFWSRGSPLIADDQRSTEETILTELWRELRTAVVCVARTPALSLEDVGLKRGVQHALRPHEMCFDLLAKVGASVDRDVQALNTTDERGPSASPPRWFGRNFTLWKRAVGTPLLHT